MKKLYMRKILFRILYYIPFFPMITKMDVDQCNEEEAYGPVFNCPRCGTEVFLNNYCSNCGKRIFIIDTSEKTL
jgi:ribosomal protein S27AE